MCLCGACVRVSLSFSHSLLLLLRCLVNQPGNPPTQLNPTQPDWAWGNTEWKHGERFCVSLCITTNRKTDSEALLRKASLPNKAASDLFHKYMGTVIIDGTRHSGAVKGTRNPFDYDMVGELYVPQAARSTATPPPVYVQPLRAAARWLCRCVVTPYVRLP